MVQNEDKLFVFMDFKIGDMKVGRVIIELLKNIAPKTCENFRALCTGECGTGKSGNPLHYKGSIIHKTVAGVMMQGGDIVNLNGTGGESIYGPTFEDENFDMELSVNGVVGMSNSDKPDTNSSQFFIAVTPVSHLTGKYVAFGVVRKGLGVVQEICDTHCKELDKPADRIEIIDCGEFPFLGSFKHIESDGDDRYPAYPEDWEIEPNAPLHNEIEKAIENIKRRGNQYFTVRDYGTAESKYAKALRYIEWVKSQNEGKNDEENTLDNIMMADLQLSCMLNQAATKLLRGDYRSAIRICQMVIERDPKCDKAYFRRAKAHFGLRNYEDSLNDLKEAQKLSPLDRAIKVEIAKVKSAIKTYLKEEKEIYGKMLQVCED